MSGLPIMPAMPAAAAFQRDAMPLTQPAPGQGVAATARPLTSAAVQQAPAAPKTPALQPQVLPTPPDRRARLVGPPPTFDVNVLQDMYETRKAPPEPEMLKPEIRDAQVPENDMQTTDMPDDAGPDADTERPQVSQPPSDYSSYAALLGLAGQEGMADMAMDRSV